MELWKKTLQARRKSEYCYSVAKGGKSHCPDGLGNRYTPNDFKRFYPDGKQKPSKTFPAFSPEAPAK